MEKEEERETGEKGEMSVLLCPPWSCLRELTVNVSPPRADSQRIVLRSNRSGERMAGEVTV